MGMEKPTPLPINDPNMLRIIRQIAEDTSNIYLLPHAKKRMSQRKISLSQIYSCLRKGIIYESAHIDLKGDWKCTLTQLNAGDEIHVSAVIKCCDESGKWIAVITVF